MSLRRFTLLIGAIVVAIGVIGLLVPVSIPGPDGGSIGCGNGIVADLTKAKAVDDRNLANLPVLNQVIPHTDYVPACQSAVSSRRAWAIPVTVIGLVVIAGSMFVGGRTSRVRAP